VGEIEFDKSAGRHALTASTLAFTVCFAVWTIFSIIGLKIKAELGLNETQFGILVATPILTGSLSRLFLGIWSDQFGGRSQCAECRDGSPYP
jgi:MFS transporter, NNP family, nitrate/nitrite transporter